MPCLELEKVIQKQTLRRKKRAMKKLFVLLCTFALIFGAVGVAIAMLVDFDDIDTGVS